MSTLQRNVSIKQQNVNTKCEIEIKTKKKFTKDTDYNKHLLTQILCRIKQLNEQLKKKVNDDIIGYITSFFTSNQIHNVHNEDDMDILLNAKSPPSLIDFIETIKKQVGELTIEKYLERLYIAKGELTKEKLIEILATQKKELESLEKKKEDQKENQKHENKKTIFYKTMNGNITDLEALEKKFTFASVYPTNNTSYLEETTNDLKEKSKYIMPLTKPIFLSPRDINLVTNNDFINLICMPEYRIFKFIHEEILKDDTDIDYKLSPYRLCVIGEMKKIDSFFKNSKYFAARDFFLETDFKDSAELSKIPNSYEWSISLNKLFIQFMVMRKLIFNIMIQSHYLDYKTDHIDFDKTKIHGIILLKLKNSNGIKNLPLIYFIQTIKSRMSGEEKYCLVNLWGDRIYLDSEYSSYYRLQYVEANVALYTLRETKLNNDSCDGINGIYVYKINDKLKKTLINDENDYYVISKYTIEEIEKIYTNLQTAMVNTYKTHEKTINNLFNELQEELKNLEKQTTYRYKNKSSGEPFFVWNIDPQYLKDDKDDFQKHGCIKNKYYKYKLKYLKLKSMML